MQHASDADSGTEPPGLEDTALFLDLDGTIVGFRDDPAEVALDADVRALLGRLHGQLGGALAVVSGRRLEDLDRVLRRLRLPAAGLHGAERRDAAGRVSRELPDPALDRFRAALAGFSQRHPEVEVEDKGAAVALHYRRAPANGPEVRGFVDRAAAAIGPALDVMHGNMVSEVRTGTADKGVAIAAFMAEPPFLGRRPVFLGDDVTDEDGFRVVRAAGGLTIRVGGDRATRAEYRLPDVAAALAWLSRLSGSGAGEG